MCVTTTPDMYSYLHTQLDTSSSSNPSPLGLYGQAVSETRGAVSIGPVMHALARSPLQRSISHSYIIRKTDYHDNLFSYGLGMPSGTNF